MKNQFELIFQASEGTRCVMKDSKYGYINDNDEFVIPCVYDHAFPFSQNCALVCKDGLWGVIDNCGNEKAPFQYSIIYPFSDDMACFSKDDKYGFINRAGEEIIGALYDEASPFSSSCAKVRKKDKWGYIDKSGNVIIPFKYADAHNCVKNRFVVNKGGKLDSRWGVTNGGKWYVLNDKGETISKKYSLVTNFIDGYAKVNIGGRYENNDCFMGGLWGIMNIDGEECVPLVYEEISNSMDGCFRVKKTGKYGVINSHGEILIPIKYDFIAPLNYGETFAICDGTKIYLK